MQAIYYFVDSASSINETEIVMTEHDFFVDRQKAESVLGDLKKQNPEDYKKVKIRIGRLVE